jgi:hypothetical protein
MKNFTLTLIFLLVAGVGYSTEPRKTTTNNKNGDLLHNFHDNAEWHEDFAIDSIEGWIMKDLDGLVPSGPFQDYPNKNTPMAFIVYNPSQTIPANTFPEFAPRTGDKAFMSIGNNAGPNNDWLITRELAAHNGGTFSFYAKGTFSFFGPEEFKVGYSTTGSEESDFTFFHSPIEASFSWTQYQYTIPAAAKHIAIVHVSYAYCFMVDDISFSSALENQAPGAISNYEAVINMVDGLSVNLSWTNPALDANGNSLSSLEGIKIYRGSHPMGFAEIADITEVEMGEISQFSDNTVDINEYYAYRLIPYNTAGPGQPWTSDFLYLATETVPGAPHTVEFTRNDDLQTVISWNEVTYGENGGLLQDPVTGYTVIRKLGNQSETLVTIHPETTFIETDIPGFNLYRYEIIAHTATHTGPPAVRNTYSGMGADHHPVTFGVTESNQVFELTRNSILSQSIYMADEIGSTGLITGLSYFSNLGASGGNMNYKIYMSTTERQVFGPNNANAVWEYYADQKLVFDGPITFNSGRHAVEIDLDQPFYFDEDSGKNIIITVIKPLIDNPPSGASFRFMNTPVETMRTYYAIGFGVDMSTITQQPAVWATEEVATIPSIVTTKIQDFGTISGTVVMGGEGTGMEDVNIEVLPSDETGYQQESVTTDSDGEYIIPALLPGGYTISFAKEGFNTYESSFTIIANQHIEMDVVLSSATPVIVSGVVMDNSENPIANAYVKLSGYSSHNAITSEAGEFSIQIFGGMDYEMEVTHPLYFSSSQSFTSEEEDFSVPAVFLDLMPHKPMNIVAEIENGNGIITWEKPYGLDNQTMLEWGSLTNNTAWGWGGAEFTAGIRFTISDLNSIVPEDGKLTHIKAYIANHATIHLEVFEGPQAAELIYTHPESITEEGWYTFELNRSIPIDKSKELWIGIRFEPGYGAYPIGIDEGPNAPQRKGSMLYDNGTWTGMSLTNKNWNIYGVVNTTVNASPDGYKVFRGLKDTNPETWTELTSQPLAVEEYEDQTLADADPGIYRYGVLADYGNDLLSQMTLSNDVMLDVLFNIAIKPMPNAGSATGTYISLFNDDHFYEKTLSGSETQADLSNVWLGTYTLSVQLENFEKVLLNNVSITSGQTIEVPMTELLPMPVNLTAQQEEDASVAYLSWTIHAEYTDDIETYPDFEKNNISDYILKDLDGLSTYTYTNFTWPGAGNPMSFMVFNPFATTPPINLDAHSGRRYLVALAGPDGPGNDWLIIPAGAGKFSFFAQSLVGDDPETFRVLYSTSDSETNSFTVFDQAENISPPASWTEYSFYAPEDTRFVAINYISDNTYFLMLDDISYQKEYKHFLHFNIYLDGNLIAENLTETDFMIGGLTEAYHMAEVEAVYSSGVSEKAQIELQGGVGIDEYVSENNFSIYPNPSRDRLNVNLMQDAQIIITNMTGTVVFNMNLPAGENVIYPVLTPGTYIIQVIHGNEVQTKLQIIK